MKLLKKFQAPVNSHFALLYNFNEIQVRNSYTNKLIETKGK